MNIISKVAISVLLATTVCSVQLPIEAAAADSNVFEQVKIDYDVFTLPNGLTTLVYSDHTVPTVFVGVWYRVGSKDEPEGKTGFAHLFEHLMFQQTANRQGEYFLPFDQAGATDMNGTTSQDRTNYYQTIPSNALDMALWMESDRMGHLPGGITQAVLDEQREVVRNEKLQGELQPGSKGMERYLANYYPKGHPYAHEPIGSMEDLNNATLADVHQWFKDYYGASNAVLVLAGDIDAATARQKVSHYFGDVPAGKPIDRLQQWIPDIPHIKRDINYDKVGTASFSRTWPLPDNDSRDATMMQLVARTLSGSKNTPLYQLLVDELQLAINVSASVSQNDLSSAFSIGMALKPGVSVEQAGKALDNALQGYFKTGPDKDRLNAIMLASDIWLLRSLENNAAIGSRLIEGYVHHNNPMFFMQQRQWLTEATPNELKTLAQRWLNKPYYESQILPAPVFEDGQNTVDRSAIPAVQEFKGKVQFPDITETTLSNGMKLVVAERHNLPLVDISLQFNTGTLAEDKYAQDAASQAFGLLLSGSKKYNAQQLAREMDKIGTVIRSNTGLHHSSISWGSMTATLDKSFALATEVVRHPVYPQAEIDKIIANIDASYDAYERNPVNAGSNLYAKAIWGSEHPFGKIDSREQAKKISRQAIVDFHQHEIGPNNATLYMIGNITLEQARKLAEKHFGNWKKVSPTPLNSIAQAQGITGRVILIDAPGAGQSSISAGHIVAPFNADTAATEVLMNAALGAGFNSRLNMNLREEKGWAYGFSASVSNTPVGERVFTASGTVQADKTAASMLEIKKEITGYVTDNPITETELSRDKAASIYSIPSSYTSGSAFLSSIISSASFGLPYNRAESAMDRLAEVTLEQVSQQAHETYKPDEMVWVIAGDLKKIEQDIRALNFGPVEVWDVYGNKIR